MRTVATRPMRAVPLLVGVCGLFAMLGCGEEGPSCGPGTVRKGEACVLVDALGCGPGTVLQGGLCVPESDGAAQDATDGSAGDAADTAADTAGDDTVDAAADVTADTGEPVCTPDCAGKVCGSDGCFGSCGACQDPTKPLCVAGACAACVPDCSGKACGDDGCGGTCGACGVGQLCASGTCVAPPPALSCLGHCGGKAPGGCSCTADCADLGDCCADVGQCGCVPDCLGKVCGDDGCGGSCGGCTVGATCIQGACSIGTCTETTCNGNGTCSLAGCACDPGFQGTFCEQCAPGYVSFPACVTACTSELDCDDGQPCTADSCDKALGCVQVPTAVTCTDGDPCTQGDACLGGVCKALGLPGCDDANPCTVDACDVGVGCTHLPGTATVCDDGDPCTSGDACAGAACKGTAWNASGNSLCDDGNVCSDDGCDSKSGCSHSAKVGLCDDGNPCTTGAACNGIACVVFASKPCDDGNACTDDSCDSKGACVHAPSGTAVACDDGDLCTAGDTCDGKGGCGGGPKICALGVTKGLVARYGAAQTSTLAYGADAKVVSWQDQSGGGHHLGATAPANAALLVPTGVFGRPGVRLDGATLTSAAFDQGSDATIAAVICSEKAGDLGPIASQGGWTLGGKSDGKGGQAPGITVGGATVTSTGDVGACHVVVARIGGTSVDLARSATQTTFAGAQGTLAGGKAPLQLGGAGASGVVGELLIYDRALSDDERDAVATYLRTAWGLPRPQPDVAWFDAADLATVVTATVAEPNPTSGVVEQWRDKSGQQHHATPVSGGAPTWFASGTSNGRPAIRFEGSTVRLQTAALPTSAKLTMFAVFELDAPAAQGTVVSHGDDAAFVLRRQGGTGTTLQWQIAKDASVATLGYKTGAWQLVTARQDGTAGLLYADPKAAAQAQVAAPIAAANLPLVLGNGPAGGRSLGGFIAEVQLFSAALSTTDRVFVESGLRVKYGL